ncbi:YhcH/YjgK/YiaL family protein [Flavobacterium sp. IB48]|uniref:YhcH/YjgK/YiaL family protein n=1 Tax=Flavobacterium sp. IB48 TaxID=2779375 RepID=UPI0018E777DE|nr:YhcH/YjgK/YiaL family protein [Flavobacterium sp. IB48]MBJ2126456.1 YhcH/YjgK/YiaL family protein [Flavobacterium sp. IB48]
MIIDKFENLVNYSKLYPEIDRVLNLLKNKDLNVLNEKISSESITLIPIYSKEISPSFNRNILEAHKQLMDIHISLEGEDIVAFADVFSEVKEYQAYDELNDFALYTSDYIKKFSIPKGYFCIIPNNFAHMALYEGHSDVKKVVVKMSVSSKECL